MAIPTMASVPQSSSRRAIDPSAGVVRRRSRLQLRNPLKVRAGSCWRSAQRGGAIEEAASASRLFERSFVDGKQAAPDRLRGCLPLPFEAAFRDPFRWTVPLGSSEDSTRGKRMPMGGHDDGGACGTRIFEEAHHDPRRCRRRWMRWVRRRG